MKNFALLMWPLFTLSCAASADPIPPPGPQCGDGKKDSDEECDDGNDVDNDTCTNSCKKNQPKRVFVTSKWWNGDLKSAGAASSGLEGADRLCNSAAEAASLGGGLESNHLRWRLGRP
jgi:cysteine-rich repeat protein